VARQRHELVTEVEEVCVVDEEERDGIEELDEGGKGGDRFSAFFRCWPSG